MKKTFMILALAMVLVLTLCLSFGKLTVKAKESNEAVKIEASIDGDTVTLKLVAVTDIENFGGLDLGDTDTDVVGVEYDTDAFTYSSHSLLSGANGDYFPETGRLTLGTSGDTIPAGTELFVLTLKVTDSYTKGEAYDFTFNFCQAYDTDLEDYDWMTDSLTATIQEEEDTTEEDTTEADTTEADTTEADTTEADTTEADTTAEETTAAETTAAETTAVETTAAETTAAPETTEADTIPPTGDNSHMTLWYIVLAASVVGLGGVVLAGSKKRKED